MDPLSSLTLSDFAGLGLGGSYTGIQRVSTPYVSLSPRLGIAGHLDMAVCFGKYFAIESEIIYEGASIMAATKSMDHRIKTRTVDIPILLSLRMLDNRIRVNVGALFTVMSNAEYAHNGDTMFYGPVHPTWNIAAGFGVGITRNFIFEARYIYALKDTPILHHRMPHLMNPQHIFESLLQEIGLYGK